MARNPIDPHHVSAGGSRTRLRIGLVAGETSGDIVGARVVSALRQHFDEVVVEGIGGPLLEAQGLRSLFPMERLSVMGFVEPLKRLPELLHIRRSVVRHFRDNPPDLFLGIDAPDFNLGVAARLHKSGIKTVHLVSPSVWAWRRGRVRKIARAVDMMLCLFPFELDVYRATAVDARFVGHPMADDIPAQPDREAGRLALGLPGQGKLLALLPGSRASEVALLAPLFLDTARRLCAADPQLTLVIPAAGEARFTALQSLLAEAPDLPVTLLMGQSREVLAAADAVLVASGTATLEAALSQCPMVVAYRMAPVSWWLLSRLVRTPFAALPNVLSHAQVVPELLQDAATAAALVDALQPLLQVSGAADRQRAAFLEIRNQLQQGFARRTVAALRDVLEPRDG